MKVGIAAEHKPKVEVLPDVEGLSQRSLELFLQDAQKAIDTKGSFYIAISGGHTPEGLFELLGDDPRVRSLLWEKIQLFWVDERCVDPDSQWSNYKLAADTFLQKVSVPERNVHRIPTECCDSKQAADYYEATINEVFDLHPGQLPVFDLIVLGMGEDGHTGSLFPNSYAPLDKEDLACVVYVLDGKFNRITLTHPVICAASHIAVLVSGEKKAGILREVLTSEPDEIKYPIHLLWPILDKVTWLIDSGAAKFLEG